MHSIQLKLLNFIDSQSSVPLKLRWIAREIGEKHPQIIKHHLQQLECNGFIKLDFENKQIARQTQMDLDSVFISLPIMGAASCGSPTAFVEGTVEGYLKVSRNLIQHHPISSLFVIKASGDSMNKANINGKNIEDGDFVIVQKFQGKPQNKEYIVSIIDNYANIKRFYQTAEEIALISESTHNYPPIFVHENDQYHVAGRVVKIIKKPNLK